MTSLREEVTSHVKEVPSQKKGETNLSMERSTTTHCSKDTTYTNQTGTPHQRPAKEKKEEE